MKNWPHGILCKEISSENWLFASFFPAGTPDLLQSISPMSPIAEIRNAWKEREKSLPQMDTITVVQQSINSLHELIKALYNLCPTKQMNLYVYTTTITHSCNHRN